LGEELQADLGPESGVARDDERVQVAVVGVPVALDDLVRDRRRPGYQVARIELRVGRWHERFHCRRLDQGRVLEIVDREARVAHGRTTVLMSGVTCARRSRSTVSPTRSTFSPTMIVLRPSSKLQRG